MDRVESDPSWLAEQPLDEVYQALAEQGLDPEPLIASILAKMAQRRDRPPEGKQAYAASPRPSSPMMEAPLHEVTLLLQELSSGNREAMDRLLPLVYDQLRTMAHQQRLRWQGEETLNTTGLVHEAYLRLSAGTPLDLESRKHFLHVAAQGMRYILLDHAKAKKAQKRGGHHQRVAFEEALAVTEAEADELIALDAALTRLKQINQRQADVVECRFFAGLTIEDTAIVLSMAPATVKRDWKRARAWLLREIQREE